MIYALTVFKDEMTNIDIPYEFMRWSSEVNGVYCVGEYTETSITTEDGYEEGTMILTCTGRGSWLELEKIKEKIKNHFPAVCGLRRTTKTGTVVFYYSNSSLIDTGEADLKRIQINIDVKQWKGAM